MLELAQFLMSMTGFGLPLGILLLMSGRVKARNELDTITRVVAGFCIGLVCYWLIGYSLISGRSVAGLFGLGFGLFGQIDVDFNMNDLPLLLLYTIPCILATASLSERGNFIGSNALVGVAALFIVPLVTHWVRSNGTGHAGWISGLGFNDQTGAEAIFVSAGAVGLAASAAIGPRRGRFPLHSGRPRGHSPTMHALGVIVMIFGTAGLSIAQVSNLDAMPDVLFKVLLGASFAVVSAMILLMSQREKGAAMDVMAAALAGAIALVAFAPYVTAANAALIGLFAGTVCIGLRRILMVIEVDDPGDLIATFLAGGLIGGLLSPVLQMSRSANLTELMIAQLIGIFAISAWSFGITYAAARVLDFYGRLRVSEFDEARGLSRAQFGIQSEMDFFLSQMGRRGSVSMQEAESDSEQSSQLAQIFGQAVVRTRNEAHRAVDRIQSATGNSKENAAMTSRIRFAEDTLKVKAEDIMLLLDGTLNSESTAINGVEFRVWLEEAMEILLQPALQDLEQFCRHMPLQAEFNEIENLVVAATSSVTRTAHQLELLHDFSDAQIKGFYSRDHSCDLASLLKEQSSFLKTLAEVRNSPIQIDCTDDSGLMVNGDANAFSRIISLAVEGALARLLGEEGQPVRVELRKHSSGQHIVFECLDTGTALSARQIRTITNPLHIESQLSEIGLRQILPLMLVGQLVEAIGGEMTLSSEQGLGTLMHCRFRMASTQRTKTD
ncbi:Ammonia channel protein AmtB [Cohaesibacter sp. ES.047]|uniref:hypothetical protein n=1 Tax=Cohaesibacter sp. ES.047 TaxID=1798205 RepID=UPI000BB8109F|nr:hypothetical protein [Cohaesibacter sp. ES.047]SNY92012.1 Ammonia channel protein AmtB [Cohaesibacter sp. ES.047]